MTLPSRQITLGVLSMGLLFPFAVQALLKSPSSHSTRAFPTAPNSHLGDAKSMPMARRALFAALAQSALLAPQVTSAAVRVSIYLTQVISALSWDLVLLPHACSVAF